MRQTHAIAMEYDVYLQRLYIATGLFSVIALCFLAYVTM